MGRTKLRTATIIACIFDAAAWILVALATFMSGSDPATSGLDQAAGFVVTALFLVTAAPACTLIWLSRAPVTALVLALAFPAIVAVTFVATIIAFA
jgi:hypothetical protein